MKVERSNLPRSKKTIKLCKMPPTKLTTPKLTNLLRREEISTTELSSSAPKCPSENVQFSALRIRRMVSPVR